MESARQTTPGRSTGPGRSARAPILLVHLHHDREERCQAGSRIRASRRRTTTRRTRTGLLTDPGLTGVIGLLLVQRLSRGRRFLRWWRLFRGRRRVWGLVTP